MRQQRQCNRIFPMIPDRRRGRRGSCLSFTVLVICLCLPVVNAQSNCPSGSYGSGGSCALCPDNSWSGPSAEICTANPGYYMSSPTTASPCAAETYSTAGVCTPCPAGLTSDAGSSACVCRPGSVQAGGACQACPSGTYSTGGNGSTCSVCQAGKIANSMGTSCTSCLAGSYKVYDTKTVCNLCPYGKYSDQVGMINDNCVTCPEGKYTLQMGSRNGMCTSDAAAPVLKYVVPQTLTFLCKIPKVGLARMMASCDDCNDILRSVCPAIDPVMKGLSGYTSNSKVYGFEVCWDKPIFVKFIELIHGKDQNPYFKRMSVSIRNVSETQSILLSSVDNVFIGWYERGVYQTNNPNTFITASCWNFLVEPYEADWYHMKGAQFSAPHCLVNYELVSESLCRSCPMGTFGDTSNETTICRKCFPGTYSDSLGSGKCRACAIGSFSFVMGASSSAVCVACVLGQYLTLDGCVDCLAGTYSTSPGASSSAACGQCDPGLYSSGIRMISSATCLGCNPGTYSTGKGIPESGQCIGCLAGEYSDRTGVFHSSYCLRCQQGLFSSSVASTSCLNCLRGTFSSGTGLNECLRCTPGTFNTGPGKSVCTACSPGNFCPGGNATEQNCTVCTMGQSVESPCNTENNTVCGQCPPLREHSLWLGLGSGGFCPWVCEEGYSYEQDACVPCAADSWCSANVSNTCPVNSISNELSVAVDACVCRPGYTWTGSCTGCLAGSYKPENGSSACLTCPSGMYCIGAKPEPDPCPEHSISEPGSNDALDCRCHPGYYQSGILCLPCDAGSYKNSLGPDPCVPCPDNAFCPEASARPSECPAHSVSPGGSTVADDCR
jgi:hypothetical protein